MNTEKEEKIKNAIDMVIALTVEELAEDENCDPVKLLPLFLASRTAEMLYDDTTKLWWSGPSDIAEMFRAEPGAKRAFDMCKLMKKTNTPQIRFAGFTDAWEQRKLGEVTESIKNGYSYKADGSRDHTYKITRIESISTGVINTDKLGSSDEINESYRLQDGDILFSHINSLQYIANTAIYTSILGKIYHGMNLLNIRAKSNLINSHFLLHLLKIESNRDWFRTVAKPAVNQASISTTEVGAFEFLLPNLKEQQVIADYFDNLDNLITLHQRKCDALQKFKRAMLQKMFPQNGESVPEIRFAGFTDAWEQRKLGDLMEITSVKRIHQSDWTDSGVRFLRARDIVAVSKNEEVSEPLFISQEKYDEYSALSGKVKIGDLLVTGVGTIGVPMLINSEEPLYFKDGNIIWFKNENRIDGRFFYYSFNGSFIQNFITESSGTGTVGTYTIENGKKTPINLPVQKDEQEKIGAYFSHLDNLITLHQRKLETLQKMKKALLQKMFV